MTDTLSVYTVAVLRMVRDDPYAVRSVLAVSVTQRRILDELIEKGFLREGKVMRYPITNPLLYLTEAGADLLGKLEEAVSMLGLEDEVIARQRANRDHYLSRCGKSKIQ